MYLSEAAIAWAVDQLRNVTHPFVGITFLACKRIPIPIGDTISTSVDAATKEHLETHHKLDPASEFFFQPFKSVSWWVAPKYASSGLQAINTQTFDTAFLHPKKSREWGFDHDYIANIATTISQLSGYSSVPIEALAIWIGKHLEWSKDCSLAEVVDQLISEYELLPDEVLQLFDTKKYFEATKILLLADDIPDLVSVSHRFAMPDDAPSETEGTLNSMTLRDIGPAKEFDIDFGERLTLIAGDNGLGKSFLLDAAWWAITGRWAGSPAFPFVKPYETKPSIDFTIQSPSMHKLTGHSEFDWANHSWTVEEDRPSVSALSIYARVDGSFAVSDRTRARLQFGEQSALSFFTSDEVWNGKAGQIEGLVRDWVTWQMAADQTVFPLLARVLEHLSPEDLGKIVPGEPVRILRDPRLIPTIEHSYGRVPIVFSSAGVQRILLLAYLVIWSWHEHKIAAEQVGEAPLRKMVIVVDELEAHLHPKWQRIVLPSLMTVGKLLSDELEVQVIAASHSPMVLASIETDFSSDSDALYHLDILNGSVVLEPLEFQKYGDISAWLTSPVFGLNHARSREASKLIDVAKSIQLQSHPDETEVSRVTTELSRVLSADDPFWSRWTFFAKTFGVDL